nr:uncharacterized protein LOC109169710 isoform X2 [Ipomoea batatas]
MIDKAASSLLSSISIPHSSFINTSQTLGFVNPSCHTTIISQQKPQYHQFSFLGNVRTSQITSTKKRSRSGAEQVKAVAETVEKVADVVANVAHEVDKAAEYFKERSSLWKRKEQLKQLVFTLSKVGACSKTWNLHEV